MICGMWLCLIKLFSGVVGMRSKQCTTSQAREHVDHQGPISTAIHGFTQPFPYFLTKAFVPPRNFGATPRIDPSGGLALRASAAAAQGAARGALGAAGAEPAPAGGLAGGRRRGRPSRRSLCLGWCGCGGAGELPCGWRNSQGLCCTWAIPIVV